MKSETKEIIGAIIVLVIALVCLLGLLKWSAYTTEKNVWKKIRSYDIIIINQEEYSTQDVVDITTSPNIDKDDTTVFEMKDGTEITVTGENWTFKNR